MSVKVCVTKSDGTEFEIEGDAVDVAYVLSSIFPAPIQPGWQLQPYITTTGTTQVDSSTTLSGSLIAQNPGVAPSVASVFYTAKK